MIVQTACTVLKANMLKGLENFNAGTPYTYKIALYNALADLNDTTTTYTTPTAFCVQWSNWLYISFPKGCL